MREKEGRERKKSKKKEKGGKKRKREAAEKYLPGWGGRVKERREGGRKGVTIGVS